MRYTIVVIVSTRVVTYPSIFINVRIIRMTFAVSEVVVGIVLMRIAMIGLGTVPWRNSMGTSQKISVAIAMVHILRERR
jgi:hypothetical protein